MINAALNSLRGLSGRVRNRFTPTVAILLYHRIANSISDPYLLCVTPKHFEEHLGAIREIGHPMRLDELARRLREGNLPDGAVCVTFDDGYQDNLYTAKPLLERYDVPATVFMTTGNIGRTHEFWWDQLERMFLQPGALPSRLELEAGRQHVESNLAECSDYTDKDLHRDRKWTLLDSDDPTPRHVAFRSLYYLLQPMHEVERRQTLDELSSWSQVDPTVRATHRALSSYEVAELEDGEIIDVGAHTVTHPALCEQPVDAQREEIFQSKRTLERWLGHTVSSFAYPYGIYCDESVSIVRDVGFDYACACLSSVVRPDSDPFLLPRLDVYNWDGQEFASRLKKQLGK